MKLLFSISAFLFIICAQAQTINLDQFDKAIYISDFSSSEDAIIWPSANNNTELILIKGNTYLIHRKDALKGKNVFPDLQNAYTNFELQISLKLETEMPGGVCFGFNTDNSQGYILELNKKKEFRVKKINSNGTFSFITGTKENTSWQKFNMLYKTGTYNDINILILDDLVEIYLNNFFAYSFKDQLDYNKRNFGIAVSPSSKVIVQKINLFINKNDDNDLLTSNTDDFSNTNDNNSSTSKYLEKIVALNNGLSTIQKEIEDQILMLEKCKEDNIALNNYISNNLNTELQDQIDKLKDKNTRIEKQLEKLKTENNALLEFKEFYMNSSNDDDIINFLYDELHKLEEENIKLKKQLKNK